MICGESIPFQKNETFHPSDLMLVYEKHLSFYSIRSHFIAWSLSGFLAMIATMLSVWLIYKHFLHYTKPLYQRHITRILCMVPIYSITSWMTFRYIEHLTTFEFIRGIFESIVIHEFFELMMRYLGDNDEEQLRVLKSKGTRKLPPPMCCLQFTPNSLLFLNDCRIGTMQYALIRPMTTILALVLESIGLYCPESTDLRTARPYLTLINCGSTAIAMFSLLTLYLTIRDDIKEHTLVTKFLSVKFVIFLTFWQSIIIGALTHLSMIHSTESWSATGIAVGIQSFLICIEMVFASLWHMSDKCFGYSEYKPGTTNVFASAADAFNPMPTLKQWWENFVHVFRRIGVVNYTEKKLHPDTVPLVEQE